MSPKLTETPMKRTATHDAAPAAKRQRLSSGGFAGEHHVPLMTPTGVKIAHFAGPGTAIKERILAGDKPVSEVDGIAYRHDMRYTIAQSADDIRRADLQMMQELALCDDYQINKTAAAVLLEAKMELENGGIPQTSFTNIEYGEDEWTPRIRKLISESVASEPYKDKLTPITDEQIAKSNNTIMAEIMEKVFGLDSETTNSIASGLAKHGRAGLSKIGIENPVAQTGVL